MGLCVEVSKNDDGTFTVSECAPKEEMAEASGMPMGGMPDGEEAGGQTVNSLNEALSVVADLLSGDTGAQAEDAMASAQKGYGAMPTQAKQTPGRVFGE